MRLTTLLFGSLAGFAIAAKLPDCAGSCISQAVRTTGCSSRDSQCICSHDSFESSVKQCTVSNCGEGKASGAAAFVADFCKSVNDLKKRHGGYQAKGKQAQQKRHDNKQWQQHGTPYGKHEEYKKKKVTPPKYGKPIAPVHAYVASMTVWDSAPSATIYAPGEYPDSAPSPTIYAPGQYPAAAPSSNPWNVGSGHGGWPKANAGDHPAYAQAAPSAAPSHAPAYRPSFAPSYRPQYASAGSAAPSAAPSAASYGKAKGYGWGHK